MTLSIYTHTTPYKIDQAIAALMPSIVVTDDCTAFKNEQPKVWPIKQWFYRFTECQKVHLNF